MAQGRHMRKYGTFLVILHNYVLEVITSEVIDLSPGYKLILIAEVCY